MKYYVYKITNLINGRWYIGKRRSKNPFNDKYMGSGKLIKLAIQKYGISNFKKEIIQIFDNDNSASLLESQLVTKETLKQGICYNLREGGTGGFAHLNDGSSEHIERARKGAIATNLKRKMLKSQKDLYII